MSCYPKLKLTYFDVAGRAEPIRLAFHIGGVPFVDNRMDRQEFAQVKRDYVYGQLPVLEIDGVALAQSQAILRYAGKAAGLYPANDPVAALQIDEILCSLDDLLAKLMPSLREPDAEKRQAMRLDLACSTIPRWLEMIEARLVDMKQPNATFQDPKALFIHELAIYNVVVMQLQSGRFEPIPPNIVAPYTELMAAASKVLAHPKVQQWNAMHANGGVATALNIKLTYFDAVGRAEPIRMALVLGDVPFEDVRLSFAKFESTRDQYPYGQLPVLEVNGQAFAQSLAILRYVGSLSGLYPVNDPVAALRIDELVALHTDYIAAISVVHQPHLDEATRVTKLQELVEIVLPKIFGFVDKRIAFWNSKFAVGETLTIADTIVFGIVANAKSHAARNLFSLPLNAYENVVRIATQVENMDKVKDWYSKKPLNI